MQQSEMFRREPVINDYPERYWPIVHSKVEVTWYEDSIQYRKTVLYCDNTLIGFSITLYRGSPGLTIIPQINDERQEFFQNLPKVVQEDALRMASHELLSIPIEVFDDDIPF